MAFEVLFCAACCLPQRVTRQVISAAALLPGAGGQQPLVDMGQRFVVMRCLQAMCESGQLLVDLCWRSCAWHRAARLQTLLRRHMLTRLRSGSWWGWGVACFCFLLQVRAAVRIMWARVPM